ncbi:MAG TPA: hypothetical protein VFH08_11025 [Chitinophagaceae bacterium]|nr:hypothetical protein [Chitinophagaceae bacterium]
MKKTATLKSVSGSLGTSVRIILTILFLNFFVQNSSAQVNVDGNSTEWCALGGHLQDVYDAGNDDGFTLGSKDFHFAADWRWTLGQVKGKNDIANGAAVIVNAIDTNGVAYIGSGGPYLAFAGDRLETEGDAQIGFWFFQNCTSPVTQPDGTKNFAPAKTIGDLLVLADFTGGGRNADVTVLEWVGTGGTYPNSNGAFNEVTVGAAVAENNTGTTAVPCGWSYPTTSYETNAFYEGFVDLGAFPGAECFSCVMLETRSSQSITASLDDFVGGPLGGFPSCSITGNNTICQGASASFTASGGTGTFTYLWSTGATTAVISNLTAAGTYNVTVSNTSGCESTCSRTLTVNAAPTCNITGNNTICSYQSASFTASGGGTYLWSTGATTAVISNLTAAATYSVTVTSGAGCTSTCSRTLTVNNPPSCNITGLNTICSGTSTSFTATGGGTYLWSTGATSAVISNLTAAGTYSVTVTSGQGCTSSCSRELTVNNTPSCNITGNNTICSYSSASFTASGGGTYLWSTGATTAVISNLTAAGTYSVTVSTGAGCTSSCSRTLTVNDPPSCNITGNNTVCAGTPASFTATGGGTYLWSTGATGAVVNNLTAAGTYNVTVTSAQGCTSSCSRTLTVNPNPTSDAGANPAAQCRAASVVNGSLVFGTNTFNVTGVVTNGTPSWAVQSDGGYNVSIVSPNSLSTNVEVSGNVNGGSVVLRLTATSNQTPPCPPAFDDVTLTLNPLPLIKQVVGSDFCPNVTTTGSVTLLASQVGVSYQLKDDGDNDVQAPKLGDGGNLVWTGLDPGNYTVEGTFLATSCNTTSGPGEVVENPVPEVTITPVEQLCTTDGCVPLAATPSGGEFSGTGVVGTDFCPTGLAPGQYTVTYTYTNTEGCTASSSISIDVVSCEAALCTYTQGYFGNAGGLSCDGTNGGLTTTELINQSIANWGGTITLGCGTNAVIVSSAQCVIDKLPGGGKSVELDLAAPTSLCNLPAGMLKNGRIDNTLLAQTLALALNIGITSPSALSDFPLQAGTLYTAAVDGGCGSEVPLLRECIYDGTTGLLIDVINEYEQRSFSQDLIDAIDDAGYPITVGGLLSLANDALCDADGIDGSEQGVDLSEIAGAAGSINEIFDECRISQGWDLGPCPESNTIAPPRIMVGASTEAAGIAKLKVSAFPNPYRDNVRFVIESPVSGEAVLDVYTITGQKLQTLYKGHMQANETRVVDYRPSVANGMMIYKLRIGNKQVTGKLVGVKQ